MNIICYKYSKRINSTIRPTSDGTSFSFVYKNESDLHNPVIEIQHNAFNNQYNYAKIGNRYFFIDKIETIVNNLFRVHLVLDVLATYYTDIINNQYYIAYAESNWNSDILDRRIVTTGMYQHAFRKQRLETFGSAHATYVITVINNSASGTVSSYILSGAKFAAFGQALLTNSVWSGIKNFFENPIDAIVEVAWYPFNIQNYIVSTDNAEIIVGNMNTGVTAPRINYGYDTLVKNTSLEIPWFYDYKDFRRCSEYTRIQLYLPCVGYIDIDASEIYDEESITVNYTVDFRSGLVGYEVYAGKLIGLYSGNCKLSIPIGQVQAKLGTATAVIAGSVATAALGFSGHPAAAVTSGAYAIGNIVTPRNYEVTGQFSGSSLGMNLPLLSGPEYIYLVLTNAITNCTPEELSYIYGRPVMKVDRLTEYSGYVQTQGASVNVTGALYSEIQKINSLMDGGVYLE